MRPSLHYAVAFLLMVLYGGEVCPFIDSLSLEEWGGSVTGAFLLMLGVRALIVRWVTECPDPYRQAARQFRIDYALFLLAGLSLTAWNSLFFDFPTIESGLKIPLGFGSLGFFAALDLALRREHQVAKDLEGTPHLELDRVYSTTRNFTVFMIASVLIVGIIVILVVTKDIYWLVTLNPKNIGAAQLAIVAEVSFIIVTLLGYMLTVALTYSRNMHHFLDLETRVLEKVEQGDLAVFVPSRTRDEFGQIAGYTNRMIEGLRERERIRNIFGKVVSKDVAERLMELESGKGLTSSHKELAIMFADIRGFTARTETAEPEVLVADLNAYFKEAVESVNAHDGVVDKFLGDGMLAIFGLDGCREACNRAVECARDILQRVDALNPSLSAPLDVSMGVHRGPVLAGIVGSPDRLEYTVIGDVVNTTSRMESLTRNLDTPLLISEEVYAHLSEGEQARWKDMGEHQVKGKFKPIQVFGLNRH